MNSTDDGPKEFECECWNDVATSRSKHEEELVPLDVRKLDALALL